MLTGRQVDRQLALTLPSTVAREIDETAEPETPMALGEGPTGGASNATELWKLVSSLCHARGIDARPGWTWHILYVAALFVPIIAALHTPCC